MLNWNGNQILWGEGMQTEKEEIKRPCYYLGIDGGGTKTALVLEDAAGRILRSTQADACNPMDIGMEEAQKRLRAAVESICRGIDYARIALFAGIAGGASGDAGARLTAFFSTFGFAAFACGSDAQNILAAGLGEGDGIAVIMGTGICVFARRDGKLSRIGGWGYLIDGGGSGYHIGQAALAAYFASLDGTGAPSLLTRMLEDAYPDPQALLGAVYEGGKKTVASVCPTVYAAADAGDEQALSILKRHFAYAAHLIQTAAGDFPDGQAITVALAGGLAAQARTVQGLCEALGDGTRYRLCPLQAAPVMGALMRAKALAEEAKEKQA